MLRSLSGGRRCDNALLTRTVGDMRWGGWAFGWLKRRTMAWFLTFVDAAVEKPGTDAPFHETIGWFAHATPHLLLLLPTPALNGLADLTRSTVVEAKGSASVLITPPTSVHKRSRR